MRPTTEVLNFIPLIGAANVRANLSRIGGKRILALPGFWNDEAIKADGLPTNLEKSWFFAKGSVPAPNISGIKLMLPLNHEIYLSGLLNLRVGVLNC